MLVVTPPAKRHRVPTKTGQGSCACKVRSRGCRVLIVKPFRDRVPARPKAGAVLVWAVTPPVSAGKDCSCPHCKTVQGPCACKAEAKGCPRMCGDTACKCGEDCPCPHCKTGQGSCACKAGVKECPCPMRSGKMKWLPLTRQRKLPETNR